MPARDKSRATSGRLDKLEQEVGHAGVYGKGRARREQIIAAATSLILKRGYSEFSLREVANRCDIKLANLQHYFRAKTDLVIAVILQVLHKQQEELALHFEPSSDLDSTIRKFIKYSIESYASSPAANVYTILHVLEAHDEVVAKAKLEAYGSYIQSLAQILHGAYPKASQKQVYRAARLLTAVTDGLLVQPRRLLGTSRLINDVVQTALNAIKPILKT